MKYQLENDQLLVEFTAKGAECTRIYDKEENLEYLWNADEKYWGRHAPILFPIVGRLKNDEYKYQNSTYHLKQHGFARDMDFKLFMQDEKMISFYLVSNINTKAVYPFDFRLKVTYSLEGRELLVSYQVDNMDEDKSLYFSVGGHPAFNIPFLPDTKFEDYRFTVRSHEKTLQKYNLNGSYIDLKETLEVEAPFNEQLKYDLFRNDALIYATPGATMIELYHKDHSNKITMSYNTCEFIGIWTPYGKNAPFVCLEPWNGIADTTVSKGDIDKKFGIQRVDPDNFFRTFYKLSFTK